MYKSFEKNQFIRIGKFVKFVMNSKAE